MSDTVTETTEDTAEVVDTTETTDAPAEVKEPKNVSKPCYCSFFEVGNYDSEQNDDVFTTGCTQETKRTFAQGHDARLVSFLVDGHYDGYVIRLVKDGQTTQFEKPEDAARTASESLGDKAAKATKNRQERIDAAQARKDAREADRTAKAAEKARLKAEKDAAKEQAAAEKANKPQVEVVAGSAEGDVPAGPEGTTKIKVGRWEYDAVIDEQTGTATYTDGKGDQVSIERDGYRLLQAV